MRSFWRHAANGIQKDGRGPNETNKINLWLRSILGATEHRWIKNVKNKSRVVNLILWNTVERVGIHKLTDWLTEWMSLLSEIEEAKEMNDQWLRNNDITHLVFSSSATRLMALPALLCVIYFPSSIFQISHTIFNSKLQKGRHNVVANLFYSFSYVFKSNIFILNHFIKFYSHDPVPNVGSSLLLSFFLDFHLSFFSFIHYVIL